ncbi:uncharacterized protein LOC123711576 isoform X1 [Pieris brassicae]|uniref:uncharacterized protein LOC123711576 isoform X1 n=1 Tax=Pieris brassicae TaxID=7116 RepID=UPI001E660D89|nr:uncharacterized protein LOC123711576 isoform X1 [Pieris brassicae]
MEFTDLNEESCKKSRRVRSWYLYEQFKSLEKSQLDAARKLKDRPYQERVLHKELNERRSRRRLCDQFGLCQSETGLGRNGEPSKTLLSTSTGDFYESFCKLHNDEGDIYSCDDSQSSKTYQECRVTYNDDLSHVESVASVIQNFSYDDNLTDNVKEDLQSVQRNINIAEDINLQLEAVKENLECIEKYTKMCEEGQISEGESFDSVVTREKKNLAERRLKTKNKSEVDFFLSFWPKLVQFSYRTMQLNCGNCYSDYSTQLLVAILACDMLRRGLNKMLCFTAIHFTGKVLA